MVKLILIQVVITDIMPVVPQAVQSGLLVSHCNSTWASILVCLWALLFSQTVHLNLMVASM